VRPRKTTRANHYRSRMTESRHSVMAVVAFIILGIGLGVGGVGFIVYKGLSRSDFFQLTAIRIEGCRRVSKNQVLEWSGIDIRTNLLAMDVDKVRRRLEEQAWVEKATVERQWPNRLQITVRERKPVALVNLRDGLHYVDKNGSVFAVVQPPEDMDFPVISGVAGKSGAEVADLEGLQGALRFIAYAGRGNAILPKQNISQLQVAADGDLVLFLADKPFPIYLGKEEMMTKYHRLARVLHWLYTHKKFDSTAFIRMDYLDDKVLVSSAGNG